MLFLCIFVFALLTLTSASPAVKGKRGKKLECVSGNFDNPWTVRDIFMWQPSAITTNATNSSHDVKGNVNFIVIDTNKDLKLMTECTSDLINGATPDENGGYNPCKNKKIWFQFSKEGVLLLERFYNDPCLGKPPYDGAVAYGQGYANLSMRTIEGFGVVGTKIRLEIPITSQT